MKKTVAVVGTFDTKREEFEFLIREIKKHDVDVLSIDVGTKPSKGADVDISNERIAELGGGGIAEIALMSRKDALNVMTRGVEACIRQLHDEGKIDGIISMGGSGGTTLGTAAMKPLPLGFPKVLVSTLGGSPRMSKYIDNTDMMVVNSVVDVSGLNSITKRIYCEAAGAVAGAAKSAFADADDHKPRVATTMYGLTTPGVVAAKEYLEARGYEVITFHATGDGGRAMEGLIRAGFFDGVLDMTVTEIHAYMFGDKEQSAGPDRAAGASEMGLPQVVCLGAMDMCTIGNLPTEGKHLYCHNENIPSHFRPTKEEVVLSGRDLGEKLNRATAPAAVFFPHGGLSMIDLPGQPMYNPEVDEALFDSIKQTVSNPVVELYDMPNNINDEAFAVAAAKRLDEMIRTTSES